ncbi:MAG: hypothetical protein JST40_03150 [Armatimonadetes bacterium]|nr:hypothetical protein [Armatimonadota bacterium]
MTPTLQGLILVVALVGSVCALILTNPPAFGMPQTELELLIKDGRCDQFDSYIASHPRSPLYNERGWTPVQYAISYGDAPCFDRVRMHYSRTYGLKEGWLRDAMKESNGYVIDYCLSEYYRDSSHTSGPNPLWAAVECKNLRVLMILLERGYDPEERNSESSLVEYAERLGWSEGVKALRSKVRTNG